MCMLRDDADCLDPECLDEGIEYQDPLSEKKLVYCREHAELYGFCCDCRVYKGDLGVADAHVCDTAKEKHSSKEATS